MRNINISNNSTENIDVADLSTFFGLEILDLCKPYPPHLYGKLYTSKKLRVLRVCYSCDCVWSHQAYLPPAGASAASVSRGGVGVGD